MINIIRKGKDRRVEKKYDLVKTDCVHKYLDGERFLLFRIQALKDITCVDYSSERIILVKAGDMGGYVETEDNLSQDGSCWVHENSYVYAGGKVSENAQILSGSDIVKGADVKGYTRIGKHTMVCGGEINRKWKG